MDHDQQRLFQQQILDQVLRLLSSDPEVLGVLVAGSYARGEHDAFSDIDMACFLRGEAAAGRERLFEQAAATGSTLWHLLIYDKHGLVLFENGVRLDLDFLKPSDLEHPTYVYSGVKILYDPEGRLGTSLQQKQPPAPADHPKWFEPGDPAMIDWFFWMFRQAVCWARRGAQGDYRAFDKMNNAVQSLADVRARLIEMRLWVLGTKEYLSQADPECAARMARTYPRLDAVEIVDCARRLLAEYEMICPLYCAKAGAQYPARKVEIMRRLIAEYEALS